MDASADPAELSSPFVSQQAVFSFLSVIHMQLNIGFTGKRYVSHASDELLERK